MSIRLLSSEVVNQIAAGEVVERPAHLVKELIENSLDAKATQIEVDVDHGGRNVLVRDNGSGIAKDELGLALARHATSKISLSSDLWALKSFGFRGEALASIAAVSSLSLTSRTKESSEAFRVVSHFGELRPLEQVGGEQGTSLEIIDLFANVPARLKFMKSDAAELTQIKNVFRALALANPQVEFRLKSRGELLFFWPAKEDALERAREVLNQESLIEGHSILDGFKVRALVSPPNQTVKNSKQIWIFVQGRWVQDRGLQAAIMEAYRSLLMHGEFPVAAIFLECDPEDVDVNIHPTKSQVKFREPSKAFRAVLRAIRGPLEEAPWLSKMTKSLNGASASQEFKLEVDSTGAESDTMTASFVAPEFKSVQFQKKEFNFGTSEVRDQLGTYSPRSDSAMSFSSANAFASDLDPELKRNLESGSSKGLTEKPMTSVRWASLQILGQADLTYIVTQSSKALVFVDQHAAHERVAYESLMAAWKKGLGLEVQNYLMPLALDFPAEEVQAILSLSKELERLGVFIEQLGAESLGVRAAPSLLKETALHKALLKLGQDLVEQGGSFALENSVSDICASLACHSVVRAGQALSYEEMKSLLEQMDQYAFSSFCPHGRPVFVEYPFARLERDFGRIL